MTNARILVVATILLLLGTTIDSDARCRLRRRVCQSCQSCSSSPCIEIPSLPAAKAAPQAAGPNIQARTVWTFYYHCDDDGLDHCVTSGTCAAAKSKASNWCSDITPLDPDCVESARDDDDEPTEFSATSGGKMCIAHIRVRYRDGLDIIADGLDVTKELAEIDAIRTMRAQIKHHGCVTYYCWLPTVCHDSPQHDAAKHEAAK